MSKKHLFSDRRNFLSSSLKLSAGALFGGPALEHTFAAPTPPEQDLRRNASSNPQSSPIRPLIDFSPFPTGVFVEDQSGSFLKASRAGARFSTKHVNVRFDEEVDGLALRVACPNKPLARIVARWETRFPKDTLFMGDAWERSYGDLQWRFLQPERVMPWYFIAHQPASGRAFMLGVKTQPSAFCFWTVDGEGISLWLDLRNGGSASFPGDREIAAATIVSLHGQEGESPFSALRRFCHRLCPTPRTAPTPICGNNNWYYAYGVNFDAKVIRRDAEFLARLSEGHRNRPYCVVDAGWSSGGTCPGGPWNQGDPKTFPDMPGLAIDIKKLGVRPGIWIRPTALSTVDNPHRL